MQHSGKRRTRFVSSLLIAALVPVGFNYSLTMLMFIPATAAVMFLWFSGSRLLLGSLLVVTLILSHVFFGFGRGVFQMIGFTAPALILSWSQWKGMGLGATITLGLLPLTIAVGAEFQFFKGLFAIIADQLIELASLPEMARHYSSQEYDAILKSVDWISGTLMVIFPSLLIILSAILLFCGLVIGIYMVRRNGIFILGIRDVTIWKPSEWLLVPLAIATIFVLTDQAMLTFIGWNVLFILLLFYSICGLSIVEYLMRKRRFPFSIKVLVYLFLFLTQIVSAIVLPLAALFDSKFDFRNVRAKRIG